MANQNNQNNETAFNDELAAKLYGNVWATFVQLGVLRRQINQIRWDCLGLARRLYNSMSPEARNIEAKQLVERVAQTPDDDTDAERVERAAQFNTCHFEADLARVRRSFTEQLKRYFNCDTVLEFYKTLDDLNGQVKKGRAEGDSALNSYIKEVEYITKTGVKRRRLLSRESVQDYWDFGITSDETAQKLLALMCDGTTAPPQELRQLHPRYHEQAKELKRAIKETDAIERQQRKAMRERTR
jgi:hypothetical protein